MVEMKKRRKGKARDIGLGVKPPAKTCEDVTCPWHGSLKVRGKVLEGKVVSTRAQKTVIIEYGYLHFIPKYERYERRHSRIIAYKPGCIDVKVGDIAKIAECRPLSKTKHFVVVEKVEKKK